MAKERLIGFNKVEVPGGAKNFEVKALSEYTGVLRSFIIPSTIGADFGVSDIRVKGRSLFNQTFMAIPAVVFSVTSRGIQFKFRDEPDRAARIFEGDEVVLVLENNSPDSRRFEATILIQVAEEGPVELTEKTRERILIGKMIFPARSRAVFEQKTSYPGRLSRIMVVSQRTSALRISELEIDGNAQFMGGVGVDGDIGLPAIIFEPQSAYPRFAFDTGERFTLALRNVSDQDVSAEILFLLV